MWQRHSSTVSVVCSGLVCVIRTFLPQQHSLSDLISPLTTLTCHCAGVPVRRATRAARVSGHVSTRWRVPLLAGHSRRTPRSPPATLACTRSTLMRLITTMTWTGAPPTTRVLLGETMPLCLAACAHLSRLVGAPLPAGGQAPAEGSQSAVWPPVDVFR